MRPVTGRYRVYSSRLPPPASRLPLPLSTLPVHLTGFIGRDRELDEISALVASARLVTLTGAGGSGKTRLAAETAARGTAFTRVEWVDLASVANGENLAEQIVTALHVPERAGIDPLELVIEAFCAGRVLLVLDNCEHIVHACAEFVDALLRGCPRVTVLATSREALGVANETAWLVPPLAQDDATRLFAERARAALPSFALSSANAAPVREICRRLDGIPLAIELAAARVRVLSPDQIASRLDDAFRLLSAGSRTALPRHRTLRATMEWSFGLLALREQVLLSRLSVFSGTFGLEAAERVCAGEPLELEDILDGVAALVDKSLVVMDAAEGDARYRLLETVRQYGRERLEQAGETQELARRHAEYFLSVIETAAPNLVGGANSLQLIADLAREHDNLRAALTWAVSDNSRAEISVRFVGALFWFWYALGLFREARQFIDHALGVCPGLAPLHCGRAFAASALTALAQGEYERSIAHFEQALPLLREGGDAYGTAAATAKLGAARLLGGDLQGAIPVLEQALTLVKDWPSHEVAVVFARFWRGWAAYREGKVERARELLAANATVAREYNLPTSLAHSLCTLARIELALGNVEEACRAVLEGLEIEVAIHDGWGIALGLDAAAFAAARRGRNEEATRIIAATAAHRTRLAVALPLIDPREDAELRTSLRASLGERFDRVYGEGLALSTSDVVALALAEAARHTSEHRVVSVEHTAQEGDSRKQLRVLALGPLQVFVSDRAVDAAAWGSARPRELLVYLLMHPEGRTKEQVGLAFWPEASAPQLRNSFHVTLHRLRKALGGADWVALEGDRYRVDPALVAEFDAESFEREVREATQALKRGEADTVVRLERALERYRGDLLDGEPVGDWYMEHRDRLQRMYVDALMLLGRRYEAEERHGKASEAYGRVLARDELHEEALLALLRCEAAGGNRSQALRIYRRFADKMRAELDAEPSAETVRFAEQLRAV
jgi:predicted ATPase/DNA-binding SARP family transcriptional activator